jgi:hypothetical protein
MTRAINELEKYQYKNTGNHPMNRLTYQNIQKLKKMVSNARTPTNANKKPNWENLYSNNHEYKIRFANFNKSRVYFNVNKRFPDGSVAQWAMTVPNNENKSAWKSYGRQEWGSKRVAAAITIQRALRNKKAKGPFNSREMQNVLVKHILPKLPKKNRIAVTSAFRAPSQLNKELRNRSKRVDPYWKALLNEITRRSIMKGKWGMLTFQEANLLRGRGIGRGVSPNTRVSIVRTMRRR